MYLDRYVIARENNVVRVDLRRDSDPPAPTFPGAGALRVEQTKESCGRQRTMSVSMLSHGPIPPHV